MIIRSIILLFISLSQYILFSVTESFNNVQNSEKYYYRVYFADKGESTVLNFTPEDLLSPAAIARRERSGTDYLTMNDLPVNPEYINEISQLGLIFRYASKWMNTALFCSVGAFETDKIAMLPFVKKVVLVKSPFKSSSHSRDKFNIPGLSSAPGVFRPIQLVNGMPLYLSGYTGRGVTIAVLDAGFTDANIIESLSPLFSRGGVKKTFNYVDKNSNVFTGHWHGTAVLSILAGEVKDAITGPASGADFMLFRTEDAGSEYPVEEDYWVVAAEYADSAGADIITSSLGYYNFDDPAMNYSFSDADGNTAYITVAADIAASKGILVVNSAGNERDNEWQRIIFPSDGDSVLCIGAVNQDLTISDFSSAGFSADNRVKPDLVAPGVSLPLQYKPGVVYTGSGTSYSCPVISGMCAALMQALPQATAADIRKTLQENCDRYNNPDSLYGYGLPDFTETLKRLEDTYRRKPDLSVSAGPNPFFNEIDLLFRETPGSLLITIYDNAGRTVKKINYSTYVSRSYTISGIQDLGQGIYYIKIITSIDDLVIKMIKL